jgi:ferredoxin
MLGILKGLKITLEHAFKPKVTQLYPYVKPKLPERSRGLIQLVREQETGVLRCEACLLCEKVCPPRAITIEYQTRGHFRRRPLFRSKTVNGFYLKRTALTAPYAGKLTPPAIDVVNADTNAEQARYGEGITIGQAQGWDEMDMINAIQDTLGYVPEAAAKAVSSATGIDLADLYAMFTLSPIFRLKPEDGTVQPNKIK